MEVSKNSDILLTGDSQGTIKQFFINEKENSLEIFKMRTNVHVNSVLIIKIDQNDKYFYSADYRGYLVQWKSNYGIKVVKKWGRIHEAGITTICPCKSSKNIEYLFTGDL